MNKINGLAKRLKIGVFVIFLIILGVSCDDTYDKYYDKSSTSDGEFISLLKSNGCGLFADKMISFKYDVLINEARPFTILAPKDEALSELISEMSEDEQRKVILYHIYDNTIVKSALKVGKSLYSLNGKKIVYTENGTFQGFNGNFGGLQASASDIAVKNGVIHVLENVFVPALSMGENFMNDYSKFSELFSFFSSENIDVSQGYSIINKNGNSDVLVTGVVEYEYLNPFDESIEYTVLPFADDVYDATFGNLEKILRGNKIIEEEKRTLFKQFLGSHIFSGVKDSLTIADGLNKNFHGIPVTIPKGALIKGNIRTSNGMIHEIDTILVDHSNVQARIDAYYQLTQLNLGDSDDITLATSSRSNNTTLVKEDSFAEWSIDAESNKEGGYLFFTVPQELAAATYKMYIEHEVDSGYTDLVKISVNDVLINSLLNYDDLTSVVAGTPVLLKQEVGILNFDTYQKNTLVRIDIVEERLGDEETKNNAILRVKKIIFEPWENDIEH